MNNDDQIRQLQMEINFLSNKLFKDGRAADGEMMLLLLFKKIELRGLLGLD